MRIHEEIYGKTEKTEKAITSLEEIISDDSDFDKVKEIKRIDPMNV